jgi:recombination protein RecA
MQAAELPISSEPPVPPAFSLAALSGRLSELSGAGATCPTSFAFLLVREAQQKGGLAAWVIVRPQISARGGARAEPSPFLAEDLLELGLDLSALPLVLARDLGEAGRAATHLLRSGAFALIVLDTLELDEVELPLPLMSRLHGLAQRHRAALVALTTRPADAPSLGSLVAYRAHISRERARSHHEDGRVRFSARLTVDKDKRHGPGLVVRRTFAGPPGLTGPTGL